MPISCDLCVSVKTCQWFLCSGAEERRSTGSCSLFPGNCHKGSGVRTCDVTVSRGQSVWGDECQCASVFVQGYTGGRDKDVMYCSRCLTVAVVRSQEVPVHQLARRIRSTPLASQTHCNSNTEVSVCVVKLLRYNRNQLPHLLDKGDFQSDKECNRLSYMKLVLFCYWSLVACPHDYIQYIYHSFNNM